MSMSVWLTDWLLDASAGDPALLAALRAAVAGSDRAQVVRRELDRALWVGEGVDWADARGGRAGAGHRIGVAQQPSEPFLGEEFTHAGPVQRGAFGAQLGGDLIG